MSCGYELCGKIKNLTADHSENTCFLTENLHRFRCIL